MKKLLYLIITLLCLTSCWIEDNTKPTHIMETGLPFEIVCEFKYKEHDYIKFSSGSLGGVVHNPDCKKCSSQVSK